MGCPNRDALEMANTAIGDMGNGGRMEEMGNEMDGAIVVASMCDVIVSA